MFQAEYVRGQEPFYDALRAVLHKAWLLTPDATDPVEQSQSADANCIRVTPWDTEVYGNQLTVWQCWRKPTPTPDLDTFNDGVLIVTLDGSWRPNGAGYWEFRFQDPDLGTIVLE